MEVILNGKSEKGEHGRSNICSSICLRHLIRSKAVSNQIFSSKNLFSSCVRNIFWVTTSRIGCIKNFRHGVRENYYKFIIIRTNRILSILSPPLREWVTMHLKWGGGITPIIPPFFIHHWKYSCLYAFMGALAGSMMVPPRHVGPGPMLRIRMEMLRIRPSWRKPDLDSTGKKNYITTLLHYDNNLMVDKYWY